MELLSFLPRLMNPLQKVFSILETVVSLQGKGCTYTDIVSRVNQPKSSVHRILKDLTQLGYIVYNPENKRYYGSFKLAALGAGVTAHFQLRNLIRPHLLALHQATGHTTNLGIRNGTVGVFADKIHSQDFGIRLFSEIGKTFPLHCTGLGKILLAHAPDEVLAELFTLPLEKFTGATLTEPDRIKEELKAVRSQGYALDQEEITKGIMCVAAPIFGHNQKVQGAISIAFLAAIGNERSIGKEISAILKYASLISESLGGRGLSQQAM
jgi:DNA-binding IclR family transcriptional regulator